MQLLSQSSPLATVAVVALLALVGLDHAVSAVRRQETLRGAPAVFAVEDHVVALLRRLDDAVAAGRQAMQPGAQPP